MEIFGVGPLEVLLVLILALVVLGPQDMVGTARKIGVWIRKLVRSPMWREVMETSREIREIPTTLIRDSGIEEAVAELKNTTAVVRSELNEATQAVSSEVQQASQELAAEAQTAVAEAQAAASEVQPAAAAEAQSATVEAQTAPVEAQPAESAAPVEDSTSGMPPVPPEIWPEQAAPPPFPPLSPEYPRTIPLGTAEPPEKLGLPPTADDPGSSAEA